eukprot:5335766-Pyramimonas_sp.AAC.1
MSSMCDRGAESFQYLVLSSRCLLVASRVDFTTGGLDEACSRLKCRGLAVPLARVATLHGMATLHAGSLFQVANLLLP